MQGKALVALLVVLYASAFLAGFNENLVNMALMSIMGEYGVDSVAAQWLVTGYMIVATIVVMCMAFMYRRFKLRPLYFAAAAFTLVGSVMGLLATNFEPLMAARLVQAAGSGIFIPLMMNTVLVIAPKRKLGTFLSIGGCMITFGPALAPTVCGALVTSFGWHSVFAVPLAAMAVLVLVALFAVKNMGFSSAHLDIPSTVLSAVFLCALSLGLVELTIDAVLAVGSLAVAVVTAVLFVLRQLRVPAHRPDAHEEPCVLAVGGADHHRHDGQLQHERAAAAVSGRRYGPDGVRCWLADAGPGAGERGHYPSGRPHHGCPRRCRRVSRLSPRASP